MPRKPYGPLMVSMSWRKPVRDEEAVQELPKASVTWSLQSDAALRRTLTDSLWEVDSGHNLHLLAPREVADILLSL